MSNDDKANELRGKAMQVQSTNPRKALDLLVAITEEYSDTWTVANLVLDDIIGIARSNAFWDEAIEACSLAQNLKPSYREDYALEQQACQLDQQGDHLAATEVRLRKDTRRGKWSGTLGHYGDQFAQLGEHDKAWRLYNEAAILAIKEGRGSHSVRQKMAELLLKEDKPRTAVELLITGVHEAEQFGGKIPSTLVRALKKALRASGFNLRSAAFRGLADDLITICRTEGERPAADRFYQLADDLEAQNAA
jgi:uncharacterized protein with von Willebrand factor type A (vWA) domain